MSKKIIFIAQQLKDGGAEKVIITLANAFAERNDYKIHLFIVLHSEPIIPISEKVTVNFLTNRYLKKEKKIERCIRKIIELKSVKKTIKSINNAIVISTCNDYSKIISKYSNKSNYIIAQLHNDYSKKLLRDFCNKYSNINLFVLLNETFKKEIEPEMRKTNSFTKIVVVPNFIDLIDTKEVKQENIVFSAGRFHRVKGFDRLIDIWTLICKKNNNSWKLVIAGDGEEFERINQLIIQKGLEESIILPGRLKNEDVNTYMRKSKIYVLTSYSEAFPLVVLEAMQNRLPVISFDVRTGPKHMIENSKTGYLIKDFDNYEFAEKLVLLMNNEGLREKMGNAAYEHSKLFLKENIIKKWFEIIDNVNFQNC